MNLASLAAGYLRARPLPTALSLTLLALGVGTIAMLMLVTGQLEERMGRDARGIDLVVGAKGSPMQIILSGIYHLDAPTGNIPLAAAEALAKHRMVRRAMPLALGDSWKGFRIVGARHDYVEHYGARLAAGRLWRSPMEAVLGAEVAQRTGIGVGARFAGVHGIGGGEGEEHADDPYAVVGVLAPSGTVLDRVVLTAIESVWQVHEKEHGPADEEDRKALEAEREVTVLLVQYASPLAAATLPRQINSQSELQAASPAYESARLFRIVGIGVEALRAFAAVLIVAAALSVFVALYSALEARRYDLAVMRSLGASPARLFGLLAAESALLALAGALAGLALGHALASAFGAWLEAERQAAVSGLAWRWDELWLVAVALAAGVLAALLPAWRAYRTDVARILSQPCERRESSVESPRRDRLAGHGARVPGVGAERQGAFREGAQGGRIAAPGHGGGPRGGGEVPGVGKGGEGVPGAARQGLQRARNRQILRDEAQALRNACCFAS